MKKNEEATETFKKTLEESGQVSLGDALLLALFEAARAAGTREVTLKMTDGDLMSVVVLSD